MSEVAEVEFLDIDYNFITPHIFVIKVKNGKRNFLKTELEKEGVQTGLHYYPNHLLEYYSSYALPTTELIYSSLLTLPLHPDLKKSDIDFICGSIKSIL